MLTEDGMNTTMLVSPNNGTDGFGGSWWLILLFILLLGNGAWGNNQPALGNEVQRGFDQSALTNGINGIQNSISGISNQLCNGFAGVSAGFANAETAANARQMANMNQAFASQTAVTGELNGLALGLQNCCCENRASIADLKYTVATENCADRAALSDGVRDIIASQTANTQAILDKLCQQEIDALKSQNEALRTQLNMANLTASQTAQTAQLIQDNNAQTATLINRIAPYPVPSFNVASPYYYSGCSCNA